MRWIRSDQSDPTTQTQTQITGQGKRSISSTWEIVKRSGDVFCGITVGGVTDHQAGFPYSSVAYKHTLHPPLRPSGPPQPGPGLAAPPGSLVPAPEPPRRDRGGRGRRCGGTGSLAPRRHRPVNDPHRRPQEHIHSWCGPLLRTLIIPLASPKFLCSSVNVGLVSIVSATTTV